MKSKLLFALFVLVGCSILDSDPKRRRNPQSPPPLGERGTNGEAIEEMAAALRKSGLGLDVDSLKQVLNNKPIVPIVGTADSLKAGKNGN